MKSKDVKKSALPSYSA